MEFIKSGRLPIEARSSVENASKFLSWIESEYTAAEVSNPDVYTLASWANYSLFNDASLAADHLVVESVENVGTEQTYDFSVPEHHNYVANSVVCHNTTNLPADIDVETVKEVYMRGWESGCKGVTVYRDRSRSGVLVSSETSKPKDRADMKFVDNTAPKRPESLPCEIHHATIKGEKWTLLIGLMDGRPYEVIGGLSKYVEIPRKHMFGELRRRQRKTILSKYDLYCGEGEEEFAIKDVVSVFDNPNYAGYTRTISLALRHGTPIQYIVEQLQKDKEADLFSFSKVIARCLKNYIPDGTIGGDKACANCGAENSLVYQEGCVTCNSCGSSKCS